MTTWEVLHFGFADMRYESQDARTCMMRAVISLDSETSMR